MIAECFPRFGRCRFARYAERFFRSDVYIVVIAALTACSACFGIELAVFYCYLALGIAGLLFTSDALSIVPIAVCAYMSVAPENNPSVYVETSVFYERIFQTQLFAIIAVAAVFLIARLITAVRFFPKKKTPALTRGFLALGAAYVLAGLGSGYYGGKTAVFGFIEICSLCAFYFYFYYTVDWQKTERTYALRVLFYAGFMLAVEIVKMYVHADALGGSLTDRGVLILGWGIYNNVGCMAAVCVPAAFYFALKRRNGWGYTVCAAIFFAAVCFTQSRASILFGGIIFLICLAILLRGTKGKERGGHLAVCAVLVAAALVLFFIKYDYFIRLFQSLFTVGFQSNGRKELYEEGMRQFFTHPIFGVGFYQCGGARWGYLEADAFLPERLHNTIVQLLAAGGIVAFVCYLYHRKQTVDLFFRKPTVEKTFAALSIAVILLASLFDCHIFNLGPGLIYAVLLAFAECGKEGRLKKLSNSKNYQ